MPRDKEMDTRKIVSLPASLAKAIEDFRFEERIGTESEAIRRLIQAGLDAKRKAGASPPISLREVAEEWLAELRRHAEAKGEPKPTMHDVALDFVKGEAAEALLPTVLPALGLPADPWPGLTQLDVRRMIFGRVREAKSRGLVDSGGRGEADLLTKLTAAAHREWLESR